MLGGNVVIGLLAAVAALRPTVIVTLASNDTALMAAKVVMAVLGIGLAGVARLQATLMESGGQIKARTEGIALAQQKLEEAKRKEAVEDQEQAKKELEEAIAELEEILARPSRSVAIEPNLPALAAAMREYFDAH